VPPGQTIVVGVADVAVLHLVVRVQACHCFEEASMGPRGVEDEDPSGFSIDEEARIAETIEPGAGAHDLLAAPGPTAIGAATQQQVDRTGEIIKVWTAVVRR